MTKFCVKKPFIIIVAVIIVMIIGIVSLTNMQTDLFPEMELPYMVVITTEPGASPEKVESDVTKTLESHLGTVSGVEQITSTSSENYSMIMLEFADDTDMNAGLVRVSQALDSVELPEECGKPNIMEVSMDMMATMYASVEFDGKDIKEITKFTNETLLPLAERQEGVASVSATGTVEDSVEIRLNQKKIKKINDQILYQTNEKLADAQKKIDDAQSQLSDAKSGLNSQKDTLDEKQSKTNQQMADGYVKMSQAQATKAAYESSFNSLKASQSALEAEKKIYDDAKIEENYKQLNQVFSQIKTQAGSYAAMMNVTIPGSVKDALDHPDEFQAFLAFTKQAGYGEQFQDVTLDSLQKMYDIVETRIPQIDAELANLKTEITAAQAVVDQMNQKMKGMDDQQSDLFEGSLNAAAGFGAGQAQIASGLTQMENAQKELDESKETLEQSKQAAIDNANIESLLSLETLSGLISAQNFSMPAGYVKDQDGNQWLVKVGEQYTKLSELKKMALTKIKGVGSIRLSDVADISVIDNAGETYAKINGKEAVLLSIYKAGTANTSEVSQNLRNAFDEIQQKNDGLHITPMIDQADYISLIVKSILTSILFGALLAIIVLALFLKDVKPTVIVAFSIPFSVLFAVVIMYFAKMTLNVMSLAGLCLGIGMLVDNSIVVVENIYRLRGKGIAPARAAVQGAKQVAAPIIASTLTTICVFIPMIFVTGMVSQLLIPFALTITYALTASLIVALTVVPTFSSFALRKTHERKHKFFEHVKNSYAAVLKFCLRVKVVPLAIAVLLLVLCTYQATRTGLEMVGQSASEQIMVTMTLDRDTDKETAYATADRVMNIFSKIDGVQKTAVIDGSATVAASNLGVNANNYSTFSFFIIPDEKTNDISGLDKLEKQLEEKTKDIDCEEIAVASSGMDASALTGQGLEVHIYGDEQQKLIDISQDIMGMMNKIDGTENVTNGIEEGDKQIHLVLDKNKVAESGLTVAQIFQQLSEKLTTEQNSITLSKDGDELSVNLIDERKTPDYESILKTKVTATTTNEKGEQEKKTYTLSKFATSKVEDSPKNLRRLNQSNYLSVTADTKDGYNTTLLSRELEDSIEEYKTPEGYRIEIEGESEQVMDMVYQLLQAILLGFILIYLIMTAQFQSLLSPLIILFTIPLAFTGGMIGLILFGETISAMALMGFMILMGTVVNNGIVFVDYVNQLRIMGMDKRAALVAAGKTRMRPILMTALTTILSMSVMVFSQDAGGVMQKPMAIVVCFGLIYATFMTLFIVPVMYDIFYRKQPRVIDVGEDDIDDIPDEVSDDMNQQNLKS